MELEYSDRNSRRSKVYIAVGIIVALIVGGVVFVALQASDLVGGSQPAEIRTVVVAVREIPGRKPIEEGDVATREVPVDATNEAAFARIDEVLGRVSGVPISTGQLVSRNLLASTTEGQTFSIIAPGEEYDAEGPDLRAVSINVPDAQAVAGTLVAGQRVDLLVTMPINPLIGQTPEEADTTAADLLPGPSTKVTLQQLTILSRNGTIYILRSDLATAEKITELTAAGGVFSMVLRPDQDDRIASTEGSTLDSLIEEFGFPLPKPFDTTQDQAAN
ncbi:MAG: SAF domain-containing protein [Chloroflexota bacterium]